MNVWIKYTGSDEQIAEMNSADDYITRLDKNRHTEYLICKPHRLEYMICQQARTGQPVYWGVKGSGKLDNWSCDFIPWNQHKIYDFSFTEFKEEV